MNDPLSEGVNVIEMEILDAGSLRYFYYCIYRKDLVKDLVYGLML